MHDSRLSLLTGSPPPLHSCVQPPAAKWVRRGAAPARLPVEGAQRLQHHTFTTPGLTHLVDGSISLIAELVRSDLEVNGGVHRRDREDRCRVVGQIAERSVVDVSVRITPEYSLSKSLNFELTQVFGAAEAHAPTPDR